MHLIFDARPIAQQFTGLGRYTASLLCTLLDYADAPGMRIDVLLDAATDRERNEHHLRLAAHAGRGRCQLYYLDAPAISLRQQWIVPGWVNCRGADAYFYPHFDVPLRIEVPITFVVHDLIPLLVPGYVQTLAWAKKAYFREMIRLGLKRAERCIAVSMTTRNDILRLMGMRYEKKVTVAPEGPVLAPGFANQPVVIDMEIGRNYLLYVGDRRPHKNIRRVIDLFFELRARHGYQGMLIIAGSTRNYGFDAEAHVAGRTDVRFLGNVSDAQLSMLYSATDALLFLSEYEGFGLPVVEAAHYGRRMILSDGGAIAEIAPPGACVVGCDQPLDQVAGKVAEYLGKPGAPTPVEYFQHYSWQAAARTIFPYAFAATSAGTFATGVG
ncbi:MAG: glycosyltransferase family 1 protein [Pseudomonadota bacterium]